MSARQLPPPDEAPDGEEALTVPEGFHDDNKAPSAGRDRRKLAAEVELDPNSLSGSYFHWIEGGELEGGGIVLGEVQTGKYLCHFDQGRAVTAQRIVPVEQMIAEGWQFYDTEEARTLAYAEYLAAKERA